MPCEIDPPKTPRAFGIRRFIVKTLLHLWAKLLEYLNAVNAWNMKWNSRLPGPLAALTFLREVDDILEQRRHIVSLSQVLASPAALDGSGSDSNM